jgi:dienelactone hydrolase
MTREDAEKIAIPHLVLASKDEDAAIVGEYKEVLVAKKDGKSEVETYPEMHHGWMGGRARLPEEHFKNEYVRGYTKCAEWFTSVLA